MEPGVIHFGRDRGPLVYGWVFAGHQVGGALAAWGAGWLHDVTGSYRSSFEIAGVSCILAAFGVTRIGKPLTQPADVTPEPVPV